ncbi:hypothetical protein A0H76_2151 [Hepatospora eriocheir]|uniref:Uncharacterized protein n=1 Tax=Hepatospora eriocheir TaxID=1081669 RepID=A0A1X0QFP9_9MICR|nr:hypothetical protein A0H76_2151 [Hepatospora eriocheir]
MDREIFILKEKLLVDVVIKPNRNINDIIKILLKDSTVVVFDTIGNFNKDLLPKDIVLFKYFWIKSINHLYKTLRSLKEKRKFILIIDSITFVCDFDYKMIKSTLNELWKTIYQNKCTIICINHFRYESENDTLKLIPRMGYVYNNFISYRIIINDQSYVCVQNKRFISNKNFN